MSHDDNDLILPPKAAERDRPQASRTMLGVLLAILAIAVLFALWALIRNDGDGVAGDSDREGLPTPVTIATSTPEPDEVAGAAVTDDTAAAPTTEPLAEATPIPAGYEACSADQSPLTTTTYIVDTNTTPLNQRAEPAVGSAQSGTFAPGQTGLVFSGECVVNINDGFTWWSIFNGSEDVWVASNFVTAG